MMTRRVFRRWVRYPGCRR